VHKILNAKPYAQGRTAVNVPGFGYQFLQRSSAGGKVLEIFFYPG